MRLRTTFLTAVCVVLLLTVAGIPAPIAADSRSHRTGTHRGAVVSGTLTETGVDVPPNNTPAGTDVTVRLLDGVKVIFDHVSQPGMTTASVIELAPEVRMSPCGTKIPSFLTPPAGSNHFIVMRIESTAGSDNSIDVSVDHPDDNSRLFRATCPPPLKDRGFADVTIATGAGDPRGRTPTFSEFIVVTDLRSVSSVISNKYSALQGKVAPGSPASLVIDAVTLASLQSMLNDIGLAIVAGDNPAAIIGLRNFVMFVRAGAAANTIPDSSSKPGGNIAGFLESKSATLIFSLSL